MTDTIKAVATYATAFALIMGGLVVLFFYRETDAESVRIVVAGFVGAAVQFLFGQEISTRTARQTAAATLAAGTPAPMTVTSAGDPTVTVTTGTPDEADAVR